LKLEKMQLVGKVLSNLDQGLQSCKKRLADEIMTNCSKTSDAKAASDSSRTWPAFLICVGVVLTSFVPLIVYVMALSCQVESGDTLIIVKPEIMSGLRLVCIVCPFIIIAVAIVLLLRRKSGVLWPLLIGLWGMVVWPVCFCVCSTIESMGWRVGSQVVDLNGREYRYIGVAFLQGQTLALGSITSQTDFTTTYKILGATNGDSPRRWAPIIRPADMKPPSGNLYLSYAGLIVCFRGPTQCYFTYDPKMGQFDGHDSEDYAPGDVQRTSPFVLIGPDADMNGGDVAEVLKMENDADFRRAPDNVIQMDLQNPNHRVCELARQILDIRRTQNFSVGKSAMKEKT
jgi:hypothetical protein